MDSIPPPISLPQEPSLFSRSASLGRIIMVLITALLSALLFGGIGYFMGFENGQVNAQTTIFLTNQPIRPLPPVSLHDVLSTEPTVTASHSGVTASSSGESAK